MKHVGALLLAVCVIGGCSGSPSDSDQQALAKEWSPENIAKEYEKQGKHAEAEEVRRSAEQGQQ